MVAQRKHGRALYSSRAAAEASCNEVKSVQLELVDKEPRPSKRGRPLILTKRVFLKICHHVEAGFSITAACEVEAVAYRTFRVRAAASPRLTERLKEATDIRFERRHEEALSIVMLAAERNWQAAGWYLERVLPSLYALKSVARDSAEDSKLEEEIPSEVLARHQQLLLEKAREDQQRAKSAQA